MIYTYMTYITHAVCVNFLHDWRDLQFKVVFFLNFYSKIFVYRHQRYRNLTFIMQLPLKVTYQCRIDYCVGTYLSIFITKLAQKYTVHHCQAFLS